jgi:phosphoglycolate phosphatase
MLMELMEEFECTPQESVMIGDTEYDLAMATNAGMSSIAVSYGAHDFRRLHRHRPLACLDNFSDVEMVIKNIENK